MCDLYLKIENLCKAKGVNITEMSRESGVSRGTLTDLKMGRKKCLSYISLQKIADYFNVSVETLTGNEKKPDTDDELYQKILLLDEEDQGKVDGFVSGLLSSSKYQSEEKTYQIQIAARGGGLKQITLTESQMAAILNAPEVTDLGGKS